MDNHVFLAAPFGKESAVNKQRHLDVKRDTYRTEAAILNIEVDIDIAKVYIYSEWGPARIYI